MSILSFSQPFVDQIRQCLKLTMAKWIKELLVKKEVLFLLLLPFFNKNNKDSQPNLRNLFVCVSKSIELFSFWKGKLTLCINWIVIQFQKRELCCYFKQSILFFSATLLECLAGQSLIEWKEVSKNRLLMSSLLLQFSSLLSLATGHAWLQVFCVT